MLLLCLLASSAFGQDNPLSKLSSSDEMVQMAGYGEKKLSTVLVTGSVYCETSFHGGESQPHEWPITANSMVVQAVTDELGDFIADLPSQLHTIPKLERICRVKFFWIPKVSWCWPSHVKRHRGLRLLSFRNGIRNYSAGDIRFQHSTLKQQARRE